jgi:hypothetical protein
MKLVGLNAMLLGLGIIQSMAVKTLTRAEIIRVIMRTCNLLSELL